jgi:putative transposase
MEESGLESSYGKPKYVKPGTRKSDCNKADISNLLGREIVGWSVSENKTADLVLLAFAMTGIDFREVLIFHTDRGMEFCAERIDLFLKRFGNIRSLSRPGTPIDNAVAESFYGTIKTEFVKNRISRHWKG